MYICVHVFVLDLFHFIFFFFISVNCIDLYAAYENDALEDDNNGVGKCKVLSELCELCACTVYAWM